MPLQCATCRYPAAQSLTCPECGGHDFQPAGALSQHMWWVAVLIVLCLQASHAGVYLVYDASRYYATVLKSGSVLVSSGKPIFSAWSIMKEYSLSGDLLIYSALCASVLGGLLVVLAVMVRKQRAALTVAAMVACSQYSLVYVAHYLILMRR